MKGAASIGGTLFALACVGCGAEGVQVEPPPTWEVDYDATRFGWIMNVFGVAPDDLWAVGGAPDQAGALHSSGERWSPLAPDVEAPAGLLTWVHGRAAEDLTFTGEQGLILRRRHGVWTAEATPTDEHLWGVWEGPDGVAWAVGGAGKPDSTAVLLRRAAGAEDWALQELPALARPGVRALFKVWGADADAVWVVGQNGVILRWDGARWSEELSGVGVDLVSLWGVSERRVVAVGGRSAGVVVAWDGEAWTARTLTLPGLSGVFMRHADRFHAVGMAGTVVRGEFDSLELEEAEPVTHLDLHTAFGIGERLFAVGGNLGTTTGPFHGVVISRPLVQGE